MLLKYIWSFYLLEDWKEKNVKWNNKSEIINVWKKTIDGIMMFCTWTGASKSAYYLISWSNKKFPNNDNSWSEESYI